MVFLITLTLLLPASAEPVTDELFYLNERSNMAIRVDYDTETPQVSFIDPDGTIYDDAAVELGLMKKEDDGSSLFFQIPNAGEGQWHVVYDKGANQELSFNWGPYGEAITISQFAFTEERNSLDVEFQVDYFDNSQYHYTISAVVLDEEGLVAGSRELRSDSAYANEVYRCSVYLNELNTYDAYYLMLRVTLDSNGLEVFDSAISDESFSYTNSSTPDAMDGFTVEVGVSEEYLRVDWSQAAVYSAQAYLLSVYEDGAEEPGYYVELEPDAAAHEVMMKHSAKEYRIELRYKNRNGVYSQPVTKTVDMTMKDLLSIPQWDVTNAVQIPVSYDFDEVVKTIITVNDVSEEVLLSGKDSLSVNLKENQNKLAITWWADETVSFKVSATVYSDRKTPALMLYELASGTVRTDKASYILTGSTAAGCTVTVGGQTAEVGADGIFTVTLPLNVGTNAFAVVATSASGNSAQQQIVIERLAMVITTDESGAMASFLQWLPLILTVLFSGLLCGHILLSKRIIGKRQGTVFGAVKTVVSNSFILLGIAGLAGFVWSLIGYIPANKAINSEAFYEAAQVSVPEAYAMIEKAQNWKTALIVTSVILGVCVVLAIVFRVLPATLFAKKTPSEKQKKEKPKKEKQPSIAQQKPAFHFCPHCGAENDPSHTFCCNCGKNMNE